MPSGSAGPRSEAGRPVRIGLMAISAVALGLIAWGVFAQTDYAVLPPGISLEELLRVGVQGFEAETPQELEHLVRELPPETEIHARDGRVWTLQPELSGALLAITLLSALAFWALCAFALAPRIDKPGIPDLFVCLLLGAQVIAIGGTAPRGPGTHLLSPLFLVAFALLGPFGVRFSLAFPRPQLEEGRTRRLGVLLLLVGTGVALWTTLTWLRAVAAPGAAGVTATVQAQAALPVLVGVCLALACFFLYRSSRTARLDRERRQAKWILWGIAIGVTPWLLLRALPRWLLGVEAPWSPAVDRIIEMTVPLALGIAVARERFLDIDVLIRRSILYTLLALAGAALFFGTALSLTGLLFARLGISEAWAWAIAGTLTGLLYAPARRALGRWVDRTLFRLQHAHDEAVADLEHDLATVRGQAEAAARLATFLDATLEPKASLVLVRHGASWAHAGTLRLDEDRLLEVCANETALLAGPDATGAPEVEHPDFPPDLAAAGVRLVQPVRAEDELLALLVVGEKRTERHYLTSDRAALQQAAATAAVGLERLALVQKAAEEATERRALAEVSKQKAEFFARLAHDLRTPVTAVQWSTRNLLDGLPGPLNDRQQQYLEGVSAAAGQLARLVDNLVDLGRMDLTAPERPDEAVDLAAVVREVAAALESIAGERRAAIRLVFAEDVPPIRGRKEAAFQIVINLVDNALKYTAPDTEVEVALQGETGGDGVVLTVRDHGPGLPEDRDELFTLFRQGPESPHTQAKGFGIGLHIVRTWTESLGGRITAENATDGGAIFTCRLPRWNEEEMA